MRKLASTIVAAAIMLSPISVMAVAQQGQNGTSGSRDPSQQSDQSQPSPTPNQAQNQTQTSNQGEESQLKVSQEIQSKINETRSTYSANNPSTKQSLANTGVAAENLIRLSSKVQTQNAGLATQLQNIAKSQVQSTEKISQNIDKADGKNSLVKFFTGADYKQIKEASQQMEQNRLRIQELKQIKSQIKNSGDATELQNQINVLEAQNVVLQDQIDNLGGGFSVLGWLFKWLNG